MSYSIILARSSNKVIGIHGRLPWNIPEDMAYFKRITTGHTCIVGRKTFESFPPSGLPHRKLIVVTHQNFQNTESLCSASSIKEALELSHSEKKEVFCIGGLSLYKEFLPYTTKIYLTEIKKPYEGDLIFPDTLLQGFTLVNTEKTEKCLYCVYKRE